MKKHCVAFVTAPVGEEPRRLAELLLDKKLCACVNVISPIESFFWWEGKKDSAREALLVIKTEQRLLKRLTAAVRAAHSYEVCEVIAMPIVGGSKPYLDWVSASCRGK
jgi:periplasmic divalent cation tolerance protein